MSYHMRSKESEGSGFKEVVIGLSVFFLALYGVVMLCVSIHEYFKPQVIDPELYDIQTDIMSDHLADMRQEEEMTRVLKGIEQQLERMNEIQLKIYERERR